MTKEIMDNTYEEGINFFIYTFLSKYPMLKAIWDEEIVGSRCEETHSLLETIYDRMAVKDNSHIEFRLCEHCKHSSLWFGILDEKGKTLNDIGGAFELGEGDLEDLIIDKNTGLSKRIQRSLEACYFLTVLETDVINNETRLLDAIFRDTKRRLQRSEIAATLNRDKDITDSNIGLANMELTL